MTKNETYICYKLQLQNHSPTFLHENISIPSHNSILFHSPIAYNTTASLDKLTCNDYANYANVKTYLDNVLGQKKIPTFWR